MSNEQKGAVAAAPVQNNDTETLTQPPRQRKKRPLGSYWDQVLAKLIEHGPRGVTTVELKDQLHGLQPPSTIRDLRDNGFLIATRLVTDVDANGKYHPRCARYYLVGLPEWFIRLKAMQH